MGNRKKTITALLAACLLILLCACGAGGESATPVNPTPAPSPTAAPTQAPKPTTAPEPTDAPKEPEPTIEETPEPAEPTEPAEPVNEQFETAKELIGKTTVELFEAIGMPEYSDYAQSCLGTGEDGNLYYDGFTVYTYRENGVETIRIVE